MFPHKYRIYVFLYFYLCVHARFVNNAIIFGIDSIQGDIFKNDCTDPPMETREEMADVVVTGTVKRVSALQGGSKLYSAVVEIKRVMKGEDLLGEFPVSNAGQEVLIQGFGDPRFCKNTVRVFDTRILMLSLEDGGILRLNSSVVRISLRNLDRVEHAVNDVAYEAPPKKTKSPCDINFCPFHGHCIVREDKAYCECVQSCSSDVQPICGTDDATYRNLCQLKKASCEERRRINQAYPGKCLKSRPCASKTCYYGSCRIDNRNQAVCDCEPECPSTGTVSVCGTDGVTYNSECHLKRASCEQGLFIIKQHEGACAGIPESCRTKQCGQNERCVEENGIPQCIRNPCKDCQGELFNPVCGSNGVSYDNLCELEKANCTSGHTAIKLQMNGFCAKDGCGITKGDCEYYGVCDRSRPTHQCVCPGPTDCRRTNTKICGSDHVTYDDECDMKMISCRERRTISVTSVDECVTCKEPCQFYSTCSYGRCECDAVCPSGGPPVCTSDGQRFNNDCLRKKNACEKKRDLTVVPCEQIGCSSDNDCTHHGQCRSGICSCDFYCPAENRKVCTSNGKEFDSECELKKHMCETKEWIPFSTRECLREGSGSGASGGIDVVLEHRNSHGGA